MWVSRQTVSVTAPAGCRAHRRHRGHSAMPPLNHDRRQLVATKARKRETSLFFRDCVFSWPTLSGGTELGPKRGKRLGGCLGSALLVGLAAVGAAGRDVSRVAAARSEDTA